MRLGWIAVVVVLGGCGGVGFGGGDANISSTPSLVDLDPTPSSAVRATDLAPSQIAAATVPRPQAPPPCAADDLTFWTARAVIAATTTDAVIRVRNDGDFWCEVDVAGSPSIDPAIEPDVWLEPGGWADVVVGQTDEGCDAPSVVPLVLVDVRGREVAVPTALVTCGWWLTALYPVDPAARSCSADDLDTAMTATQIVVGNVGSDACVLGELQGVVGDDVVGFDADPPPLTILDLAAGDVVSFEVRRLLEPGCTGESRPVELRFSDAGPVGLAAQPCAFGVELGAARPWVATLGGLEVGDVLAGLDPFRDDA